MLQLHTTMQTRIRNGQKIATVTKQNNSTTDVSRDNQHVRLQYFNI